VPNKIARLLKKQQPDSVQECTDTAFAFGNKWGKLFFTGADGNEYEIEGEIEETDYKETDYGKWEDEVESDDEKVSDKVTNEKGHVVTEEKMKKLLGEEEDHPAHAFFASRDCVSCFPCFEEGKDNCRVCDFDLNSWNK